MASRKADKQKSNVEDTTSSSSVPVGLVSEPLAKSSNYLGLGKKTMIAGIIIVMLLLLVGVAIFMPKHRGPLSDGDFVLTSNQRGTCSQDKQLISRYNDTVRKHGVTDLKIITKAVRAKNNYTADPTCMYIETIAGYGSSDSRLTQTSYDQLIKLQNAGKKPVSTINDGLNREAIFQIVLQQKAELKHNYYGQG